MTDYYAPASWDGIAERDGYVVVVNVSPTNRWVLDRSGSRIFATTAGHVEWPTFRPNPERRLWHVEKDGRILDSGIGLGPCADYDKDKAAAALNRIVDRIQATICRPEGNGASGAAATTTTEGATVRRNLQRAGIEVLFPAKPDEMIRTELKRKGFHWSRRQGLWYAHYSAALWDRVHQFLKLDDTSTPLAPEPAAPEPSNQLTIDGVTWCEGENDAPQTFWWHRDSTRRLWQAIRHTNQPNLAWYGTVEDADGAIRLLTDCSDYGTYQEYGILYGEADPGDTDPPLKLLTAMTHLIRTGIDPHTVPRQRTSSQLETRRPTEMTQAEILAEALELDAVIQASDSGFPKEIADRMNELRGAAFSLDPDVNLDAEIRQRRAYDVPQLVRQWQDLTERLERGHGMRSDSRAAATAKHAHLGQLAQSRDQVQDALRIAVQQAQERGEPILSAIRAEPDLARILLGGLETEAISAATLHGTGVGLEWPVPLQARKELHQRGWKPLYDEDEAGKTEAWLCPDGQDYSQVIAQVYGLVESDEVPFVRVFTWPRPAASTKPAPPSKIVIRRAEIEWSPGGHLQARDLDTGEIYVPPSPESSTSHQLALF